MLEFALLGAAAGYGMFEVIVILMCVLAIGLTIVGGILRYLFR